MVHNFRLWGVVLAWFPGAKKILWSIDFAVDLYPKNFNPYHPNMENSLTTIFKPVEKPESLSITPFVTKSHISEAITVDSNEKKFTNCHQQILASKEMLRKCEY